MTTHAIKAPAGLGKTTLVIEKIATSSHQRVEIYVPTLALAREIEKKLGDAGVSSNVIRGRDQDGDDGNKMCLKSELASAISARGYPVFPVICMGAKTPGDIYSVSRCEHFDECEYLKQFAADAQVFIYTHAYLPLPRNSQEKKRASLVVIDESFLSTCLRTYEIPRDRLQSRAKDKPATKQLIDLLLKALDERKPVLNEIRGANLDTKTFKTAQEETSSSGVSFNPFGSDTILLKKLDDVAPRARLDLLVEILTAELATNRAESHGITFDYKKQMLKLHYRLPIERFPSSDKEPGIILIDANADPDLLRQWFPNLNFMDISAARNAYVIQCSSIRGSISSLVPERHQDKSAKVWAQKNLDALQRLIDRETVDASRKVLVVGPQAVTGNPAKNVDPLIVCPTNAELAHFNGLRGVDVYKSFDEVIIVGRNQPPIDELQDLARALWFDSPDQLAFSDDWVVEQRPYLMRDPANTVGVEVLVHPDPRIQKLHEQLREGESTQAIDRLRLIHTQKTKRVIVVSNIPLAIEVDELRTFHQLTFQTRLERVFFELHGILPLNPSWLSGAFPDLWQTAAAAEQDLRRAGKNRQISNSISISNLSVSKYQYRLGGQRRHSVALSQFPLHATLTELTKLFGRPISLRPITDGKPGEEVFGAIGAGEFQALRAYGTSE